MLTTNLQHFAEPVLPVNTASPAINYETEAYLNIAEDKTAAPEWATIAAFTKNMSQSLNEVLYQASYYQNKGWGSTEVTGGQLTVTLTGDCMPGDKACEYLLSEKVQFGFGENRKTQLKLQKGDKVILWPVTIANITAAYGDAAQPSALTITIHGNGKPTVGTTTV